MNYNNDFSERAIQMQTDIDFNRLFNAPKFDLENLKDYLWVLEPNAIIYELETKRKQEGKSPSKKIRIWGRAEKDSGKNEKLKKKKASVNQKKNWTKKKSRIIENWTKIQDRK